MGYKDKRDANLKSDIDEKPKKKKWLSLHKFNVYFSESYSWIYIFNLISMNP